MEGSNMILKIDKIEINPDGVFTCPEDHLPLDYAKVTRLYLIKQVKGGGTGYPMTSEFIYPHQETHTAVTSAVIRCIHSDEGCKWMDTVRKLQGHLNVCKYDSLPCTKNCAAMIPRILMEDHLTYTCPKRLVNCEFCSQKFTGEMLEGHTGSCLYEPVYCENKCGSKLQKRFINNHRLNECPKRLIPCAYCHKEFVCETLQALSEIQNRSRNHRQKIKHHPHHSWLEEFTHQNVLGCYYLAQIDASPLKFPEKIWTPI
ncbi:TNF receptor-associated factor 4 [Nymphon striatum]|nr:TNF receptor-associated factor 4 [Nymphon striatum]